MHTVPTPADTLHRPPAFRAIDYRDDPAVYTVSTRLREAWVTDPALIIPDGAAVSNSDPQLRDIGTVIRAIQSLSSSSSNNHYSGNDGSNNGDVDGVTAQTHAFRALRNVDKDTLHTPLRDAVYHNWNHVFWDVSWFLLLPPLLDEEEKEEEEEGKEAKDENEKGSAAVAVATLAGGMDGEAVGHMHPPAEGMFAVEHPEEAGGCSGVEMAVVLEKVFETNVLLVPTFVEEGVEVRFEIGEEEQVSGFAFDATATRGVYNEPVVYWIRKEECVRITLSGDYEEGRSGVAAVFVYGKLCECLPEKEDTPELWCDEAETGGMKRNDEDENSEKKR